MGKKRERRYFDFSKTSCFSSVFPPPYNSTECLECDGYDLKCVASSKDRRMLFVVLLATEQKAIYMKDLCWDRKFTTFHGFR